MPYLVRSKGLFLQMRDGLEMRALAPLQWVRFDALPRGLNPLGDHQVEVREIVSDPEAAPEVVAGRRRHKREE